jgi:hypothetical protein
MTVTTAVELQVENVDLDNDGTLSVLGEHFADTLWAVSDGIVTMTIYIDSGDAVDHVIEVARSVEGKVPGAKVRRVHRDVVSQSDIASRTGVSREAVRKWTQRPNGQAFPAPFASVGSDNRPSKLWLWPDVCAWLEANLGLDMGEEFLDEQTAAHIDACLAKVRTYVDDAWQTVSAPQSQQRMLTRTEFRVLRHWSQRRMSHFTVVVKSEGSAPETVQRGNEISV